MVAEYADVGFTNALRDQFFERTRKGVHIVEYADDKAILRRVGHDDLLHEVRGVTKPYTEFLLSG